MKHLEMLVSTDKKDGALNGTTLYLSAPIEFDNLTPQDWRKDVVKTLETRFKINVHDPSTSEKQKRATILDKALEEEDYETVESIASCFTKADLATIDRCDFLVAYNPHGVPTTGTPCEVHHAVQLKKPVMIVCPEGKKAASKWYFGYIRHRYIFGSWDDLYSYLDEVDKYKEYENHRWWVVYKMV